MPLLFAQAGSLLQDVSGTPKASQGKVRPQHQVPASSVEPEPQTGIRKYFNAANAWLISLIVHLVMLIIAGVIILPEVSRQTSMITTISSDEVEDFSLDTNVGMDLAAEIEIESTPELPQSEQSPINLNSLETIVDSSLDESMGAVFGDETKGGGIQGGFAPPPGVKFFRKGSFTAWTVPEDPAPGQKYQILIVVELPEKFAKYRATDLSGRVVGTDKYTQAIPGREYTGTRVYLPIKDRTAQLIIEVPGGAAKVQDTIYLKSRILNESQTLEIVF